MVTSIKSPSGSIARQASRSFLKGDIKLAIHITPESAKSLATSPIGHEINGLTILGRGVG